MISAENINFALDALYSALKEKVPRLKSPVVSSVESVHSVGTFGSLVFGGLVLGAIEGKITLVMEWETALKLSSKILKIPKLESFTEDASLAIEGVVRSALEKIVEKWSTSIGKIEIEVLPVLTDSNALLSFHKEAEILKVQIETLWEPVLLYFAFAKQVVTEPPLEKEVKDAA